MTIDWSSIDKKRPPTRKELASYRKWRKYLSDSRLSPEEVDSRAKHFAELGKKCPIPAPKF